MNKVVSALICFVILFALVISSVQASISVEGRIDDSIYVVYKFENISKEIYEETKANQLFNSSTIPQIIVANMEKKNLKLVKWGYAPQTDMFNDSTHSIFAPFYLSGSDIISFTINATTMRRTYHVRTEWRWFQLNLTSTYPINFTQILAKPVSEWRYRIDDITFIYESPRAETSFFDTSFEFILPKTATQVQAQGNTIVYEAPARFEDLIVNSPFLILFALIVVTIIVVLYRKARP